MIKNLFSDIQCVAGKDCHNSSPIEHLGLTFDPSRPEAPLGVRDPKKKEEAVERVHRCPGSSYVRAKLTTAFVRPLFDWASPLLPPGNLQDAMDLFQAIAHSTVSWWCQQESQTTSPRQAKCLTMHGSSRAAACSG